MKQHSLDVVEITDDFIRNLGCSEEREVSFTFANEEHGLTKKERLNELIDDNSIPRECKHCNTWANYELPKDKNQKCFTVSCKSCHTEFEIVKGMRGARG